MREMKMLDNIVAHSIRVCQVACFLAKRLNDNGNALNEDLVLAAALLHDVTKTRSFETKENHAETAAQFLKEAGYSEIGRMVAQHVRLDSYDSEAPLTEAEILNYSDKRVLHDRVVSLEERFDYIMERYARTPEDRDRVAFLRSKTSEVGQKIFSCLTISPEDLAGRLDAAIYDRDLGDFRHFSKQSRSGLRSYQL